MRLDELYNFSAASAPLYHYTPLRNFYLILKSNKLIPQARLGHDDRRKSISFTRDYRRDFIPKAVGVGIGFRVDRAKLASRYKLVPTKHNTMKTATWINGRWLTPGEEQIKDRFESEERIYEREIDNFKQYITGVVIPKMGKYKYTGVPTITDLAMSILALSGAFKGSERQFAKDIRSYLLSHVKQLGVPFVFLGKDFQPEEVDKAIGKIYWMKKNKPEEFNKLFSAFFNLQRGRYGDEPSYIHNQQLTLGRGTRADFMGKGEL